MVACAGVTVPASRPATASETVTAAVRTRAFDMVFSCELEDLATVRRYNGMSGMVKLKRDRF
ncbi:hypothetical protein GCM10023334_016560 [Nonomuraea thailandensis]